METPEENEFVRGYLLARPGSYFWLGLDDVENEGVYVWQDGNQVNYTDW